ncbi:MAG: hypothetical protein KGH62_01485 [Candidatus Micrarchaeota archaeon]|nr:hypothetical protein [Candidatus Micrarchaeota archaeon]
MMTVTDSEKINFENLNLEDMTYEELLYTKKSFENTFDSLIEKKEVIEDIPRIKDVPLKRLVDFPDLYPYFANTHSHLPAYDMVEHELQLKGDAYYPIKKAMCYMVESLRQRTETFMVGSELGDNRINIAEMVSGGRGKGQQRKLITQYDRGPYESVPTFQPTRTHVEQLIGKIIHTKKETKEEKGFFGYKGLVVDECQTFICEEDKSFAALMLDFRNAMEVYTKNRVEKKLTAEEMMSYYPETRFLMLMHPIKLPALFFDHGTARRLFMFKIDVQPIPMSAAWASLLAPPPTSVLRDYINNPNVSSAPTFGEDAVKEMVEWIQVWTNYVLTHPNQRVRAIGQRHFTSVKLQFIRTVGILSMIKDEISVKPKTVAQGCLDAIHFLLCTYEIYANESTINLSRDVWKTTDMQTAMVFEWMHYNGATSEETTKLTIDQVQNQIGDIFGVQDRQARGIFSKLVEQGLIGKKKAQHTSKSWLSFTPELEGGVELDVKEVPNITKFLEDKIAKYQLYSIQSGNTGNGNTSPLMTRKPIYNPNSVDIKKEEVPLPIATIATIDLKLPSSESKLPLNGTILTILRRSGAQGGRFSAEAGKWDILYGFLPMHAPEAIDASMRQLHAMGAIYEPRPGCWKANASEEVDEQ